MLEPKAKTIAENQEEVTNANKTKLGEENLEKLFSKLDLHGLEDWDQDLQRETKGLLTEFGHLIAFDELNFEMTSFVKYNIKLINWTPLKERYMRRLGSIWKKCWK